jgi:hypothetical protein
MKKIILSVLALGLSMGLMAQKVYNGAEPVKGTFLGGAKSGSVIYPESFNDCASIDAPVYYFADGQSLWEGISGTNQYGDMAYGQRYTGNYQVTGIAAVMSTLPVDGTVEELSAAVVDMDGNELASVAFSTADLPEATEDFNFDLVEFNFASPVNASDFLATVGVTPFQYDEAGNIFGNFTFVASTEIGCSSGDMAYSYSMMNEAGDYGWISIYEAWGGAQSGVELDLFIFPKVSGVGLSEVELNSLSYVYPNPAKSEVMLASSVTVDRVEVINVLGQVVFASDVNANSIKVNTSEFATGNYIVKMYTEAGVATKKLIVE